MLMWLAKIHNIFLQLARNEMTFYARLIQKNQHSKSQTFHDKFHLYQNTNLTQI